MNILPQAVENIIHKYVGKYKNIMDDVNNDIKNYNKVREEFQNEFDDWYTYIHFLQSGWCNALINRNLYNDGLGCLVNEKGCWMKWEYPKSI